MKDFGVWVAADGAAQCVPIDEPKDAPDDLYVSIYRGVDISEWKKKWEAKIVKEQPCPAVAGQR